MLICDAVGATSVNNCSGGERRKRRRRRRNKEDGIISPVLFREVDPLLAGRQCVSVFLFCVCERGRK